MDLNEVIEQLKSLKSHCENMSEGMTDVGCGIWDKDVQALEYAINVLTKEKDLPVAAERPNQKNL